MLVALAGSQKLLTAVVLGMCLVVMQQLYHLVASGFGRMHVAGAIVLVTGVVIVIGGLRAPGGRRDRSTDQRRAGKMCVWMVGGVMGIVCTFGAAMVAGKMGVPAVSVARLASPFAAVFGLVALIAALLLAYYVLVLLFPRSNVFRVAAWGYVALTVALPALSLTVALMLTVAGSPEERMAREFEEPDGQQTIESLAPGLDVPERLGPPSGRGPGMEGMPDMPGRPPGMPGPRSRRPSGPRGGLGDRGGFESQRQRLIKRFGPDKVVTVTVHNVPADSLLQVSRSVRTAADVREQTAKSSGSVATVVVAPVDDVEALASKLDIGNVTEVDPAGRTITIDASIAP
jgi:hypothetical protein